MNPIDLVVTVCAILSPATCEEQHLVFNFGGSPAQCSMAAPPYIAQWIGDHPKWQALRIPAHARQGVSRYSRLLRMRRGSYFVQSFRSLSAIENTASALISISRTTHCRELG